jgi:hypothetical protein
MLVECTACKASYHAKGNLHERATEKAGISEWGFLCPNCQAWQHTHYENATVRGLRHRVQSAQVLYTKRQNPANWERYTKARESFRQAFDALQKEMVTV